MIAVPRNETSCIEKIFYETMPAEKVKIVERLGFVLFLMVMEDRQLHDCVYIIYIYIYAHVIRYHIMYVVSCDPKT